MQPKLLGFRVSFNTDDPSYHGITGYEQLETDSVVILDLSDNLLWGHAPSPILVFLQDAISFSVAAFLASCSDDSNSWNASEVCPESGRGTFVDERDGQVYKYTTIGNQVWMAENLNYETDYSICYDNGDSDCNFWGRYYSLQENNDENGKLDYARVDSVCPMGWHVPSNDEWLELINVVGKLDDRETAMRLKSTNLWNEKRESGSDDCAFSSLPAGYLYWNGGITDMFLSASYWSSTMKTSSSVFDVIIHSSVLNHFANAWMTLRCIKD